MNKYILLISFILVFFVSCNESEYLMFNEIDKIQFQQGPEYVTYYTFVYYPSSIQEMEMEVGVQLVGDLSDKPRKFKVTQIDDYDWEYLYDDWGNIVDSIYITYKNAIPNIHYYPIDEKYLMLPADSTTFKLPIIAIRDTSLMTSEYRLRLKLEETSDLPLGERAKLETRISISDILQKPSKWVSSVQSMALGTYSQVKHRFMIDVTGLNWDDDTISEQLSTTAVGAFYDWRQFFNNKLRELNAERQSQGLGVLTDENGDVVTFPG